MSRIDDETVREGGAAAACIGGAHTTAASPRQPVGEVPSSRGGRVRDSEHPELRSPNGSLLRVKPQATWTSSS